MNMSILKQIVLLRKGTFIFLAILLAAAAGAHVYISRYQSPMVEKLEAEAIMLRDREGRGIALQDRETLYRNGLADLEKFRQRLYPKEQFARFISELYDRASKSGLELTSIAYKPSFSKEDRLLSYSLTLSVSGKYAQLKKFIHELGDGRSNIMVIDSIAMTAAGPAAESVQLQMQITSWFRLEEP